ncbi:MAG: hypothetical protein NT129_05335 [Candidatus Aenigmarchaeota archaeon]|nr:hypothetical protein [Candidatus Aenigmarchaeota archaeon]
MQLKLKKLLMPIGVAALLIACSASTATKDMSSEGYDWAFFQLAEGTEHDRKIGLLVDKIGPFSESSYNILEGSYFNTGTEAPEHLRDPAGRMIFTQNEARRYFGFLENQRNDVSRIMLYDTVSGKLNNAFMSRYKTEWWGDSDDRAISINNGPTMLYFSGVTNHLGITTQEVFAVAIPKDGKDYSWMFNQDRAVDARDLFESLEKYLENTDFKPYDYNMLISTRDSDKVFDWAGVEMAPAQGELYDGTVQYVIAADYFGSHNKPFVGGISCSSVYGHQGAPDRGNKAGTALDTVLIALGKINDPDNWKPRAKIVVNHPTWSKQTEYEFYSIDAYGREELKGVLQRTYNDKSTKSDEGAVVQFTGTNNYLAKGDFNYISQVLTLLGGQQVPLGFDYKTSYMDYATDMLRIAEGINGNGMDPELVASMNVNADATIEHVITAAEKVLGVDTPPAYRDLLVRQHSANENYQKEVTNKPELLGVYGIQAK